jgi:hypothetical protein
MKVKYYKSLRLIRVGNVLLSLEESRYLIRNANASARLGCRPTNETLLGAVCLATTED